jgi:ATP-dependent Clp protease ATP-binding subunit ClpA
MPTLSVQLYVITQNYEETQECRLGEALFFPEVTCLTDNARSAINLVAENALALLAHVPNLELAKRLLAINPELISVEVTIEPAEKNRIWRDEVTLKIPAIRWQQSRDAFIVYLPSLEIEVLANKEEELTQLVEDQVRLALFRLKATRSLKTMVQQARCRSLDLDTVAIEHFAATPKQQTQDEYKPKSDDGKILSRVGNLISGLVMPQVYEREESVQQLSDALTGLIARSVLLVGASGVGKTSILKEVVRRSTELGLGAWKFWATSGSRLVSGMTGFGMWQERLEHLRKEMVRENVILHVGSLLELMEVGRSECQTQGIASFLRPAIARGEILVVAECTPEQLSLIERQDVALLRAFLQIPIHEPPQEKRLNILSQVARAGWTTTAELFSAAAIEEIERLHRRFATYSAFPARPVRFLQNLRRDVAAHKLVADGSKEGHEASAEFLISGADVTQAFSRETGLPMWLLDDEVPLDLNAAETWFAARVIGQPESVVLIVNLLATLKAQLNRDQRPLASFLFIGPTGVGKTEMARTLAEYLFGSAGAGDSRMIRIDMSEYADPMAVQRLIGGTTEAEGVLTARVREQPFAVVLLDEFEKAHHSLFDLLLQILGEGRLTDAAGRVADFRNCVVIMTSNLGAATYARGSVGFGLSESDVRHSRDHFEKSVREFVRPELFNRIDRIVPFAPLDRATARKVVERQLELIRQRDGLKYRRVTFQVSDQVIDYLLEHGFEPRYGARSLKRVMERDLLAPMAEKFNRYSGDTVLQAECSVVTSEGLDRKPVLKHSVRAQADASGRLLTAVGADAGQMEVVTRLQELRSRSQRLQASSVILDMQNTVFQLERQERKWNKLAQQSSDVLKQRHELDRRREWMLKFDQFLNELISQEDLALMSFYAEDRPQMPGRDTLHRAVAKGVTTFTEQLLDLLDLKTEQPDVIRMLLVADDAGALQQLALAYWTIAANMGAAGDLWVYVSTGLKREPIPDEEWTLEKLKWDEMPRSKDQSQPETWQLIQRQSASGGTPRPWLLRQHPMDAREFLKDKLDGVLGLYLEFRGSRVFQRFVHEDGLHRFTYSQSKQACGVFTNVPEPDAFLPTSGIERKGAILPTTRCRDYDYPRMRIIDPQIPEPPVLYEASLRRSLEAVLLRRHQEMAERMIE